MQELSITSWNINSVNARFEMLSNFLKEKKPSVMMLQEIKTQAFPAFEVESLGYSSFAKGQKSYNGVAILSTEKMELVTDELPNAPDTEQARFIEVFLPNLNTRILNLYMPNGEPPQNDKESTYKLEYKIAFMDALFAYIKKLSMQDTPFILGGDFNVIENDNDVYNIKSFQNSAFTIQPVRERFRAIHYTGLTNALRSKATLSPLYSYWDYRAGAFEKNNGILLDHIFLSPFWADRLLSAEVHTDIRGLGKPSDHAPISCRLKTA